VIADLLEGRGQTGVILLGLRRTDLSARHGNGDCLGRGAGWVEGGANLYNGGPPYSGESAGRRDARRRQMAHHRRWAVRSIARIESPLRIAHPLKTPSTHPYPTVSVVVPAYNRAATIERAVRSVLDQDYPVTDVVVVDDASTDDTANVVESIHDPRVRLIRHTTNRNGAAARNTGIDAATGELLAFVDSDDAWRQGKLKAQIAAFQEEQADAVDVVLHGKSVVISPDRIIETPRFAPRANESLADYFLVRGGNFALGSLLLRTSTARAVRFDERMYSFQELDFGIRLQRAGTEPRFIDLVCQDMYWDPDAPGHVSTIPRFDHLQAWGCRNRPDISSRAHASFMAHFVGFRAIVAGRRVYGVSLIARGILFGVVSPKAAGAAIGRAVLPASLYRRVQNLRRSLFGSRAVHERG
jgi:glycosyltransferase involved in cell wall biosynthesis